MDFASSQDYFTFGLCSDLIKSYFLARNVAFKCMTGQAPTYLSSPFLKRAEISGRETRNSKLLNVPLFKTTTGQRTFFYRTLSLWNSLGTNLKLSESLDIFKRRLRGQELITRSAPLLY